MQSVSKAKFNVKDKPISQTFLLPSAFSLMVTGQTGNIRGRRKDSFCRRLSVFMSKVIICQNPFEKMWNLFTYFENEEITKNLLYTAYLAREKDKEALTLAYQNTVKFIYLLKQGVTYFEAARNSELMVQPLLLYYGMTSLMKMLILLHDPHYPSSTLVLQHGLTTRKKKKMNYSFFSDVVKIQKDGLLPHFYKTVFAEGLESNKRYVISHLLGLIPELQTCLHILFKSRTMLPVTVEQRDERTYLFSFAKQDLEQEKLHFSSIYHLFQTAPSDNIKKINILDEQLAIVMKTERPIHPLKPIHNQVYEDYTGKHYFYFKEQAPNLGEIVIYNLIMFVLGMLCRYDTEQWGEIIYSLHSADLFLIKELIQLTLRKFPNIVLNYLYGEKVCFKIV